MKVYLVYMNNNRWESKILCDIYETKEKAIEGIKSILPGCKYDSYFNDYTVGPYCAWIVEKEVL